MRRVLTVFTALLLSLPALSEAPANQDEDRLLTAQLLRHQLSGSLKLGPVKFEFA